MERGKGPSLGPEDLVLLAFLPMGWLLLPQCMTLLGGEGRWNTPESVALGAGGGGGGGTQAGGGLEEQSPEMSFQRGQETSFKKKKKRKGIFSQ